MRTLLIFLMTVLFCSKSFGEDKDVTTFKKDSLKNLIGQYQKYNRLGEIPFFTREERLAKKDNYECLIIQLANRVFYKSLSTNDTTTSKQSLDKILQLYTKSNSLFAYGNYMLLKGDYFMNLNKVDSAYVHYIRAKNIFKANNNNLDACDAYKSILVTQFVSKDRIGIEHTAIESEKFLQIHKSYHHLSSMFIYAALNEGEHNLKRAELYFDRALQYTDSIENKKAKSFLRSTIMINYSYIYLKNKKYELAIQMADKGLLEYEKSEIKDQLLYDKIGFLVNKGKSLLDFGKTSKGLPFVNEALQIAKNNNLLLPIGFINNVLAEHYNNQKQYEKSINIAEEALKIFTKHNLLDHKLLSIKLLAKAYKGDKSQLFYEKYISLKDSIQKNQLKTKEQFALVRFDTEKKEAENLRLKQENELSKTKLINEENENKILQLISIIGVILMISFVIIVNIKRKNLQFQANLAKAEARENERKKIALNLHDKVVGDLRAVYQKAVKNNSEDIAKPLLNIKEEVRNLSHKLSSVDFDEVTFKDQMINLVSDYFEPKFRIKLQNIDDINWEKVNNEIKRTLFLVSREAIQNSKKHGEATTVIINFKANKKTVQLEIKDNGKGFNVSSPRYGIGLKNQQQRVEELNGKFLIESIINKGTTTSVLIPVMV